MTADRETQKYFYSSPLWNKQIIFHIQKHRDDTVQLLVKWNRNPNISIWLEIYAIISCWKQMQFSF